MTYRYPKDFGTVGAGNDTSAIQGAINAIRQDHGGKLVLDREAGFVTDCLDATACNNLEIVSDLGCIVTAQVTHAAPVVDLCNSHNFRSDNVVMTLPPPGVAGVIYPKAAFLLFGSDKSTFNNLTVNGTASSAIIAAIGASSVSVRDSQLIQWDPAAPTVMLSTENDWGISSMFYAGALSSINMPDWHFEQTEQHQLGGGWPTYFRNVDHIVLNGGISAGFGTAHVLFQGTCSNVTDIGRKYYKGDDGSKPNAQYVYQAGGAAVVGLTVINPSRNGIPTLCGTTSGGSFQYLSVSPSQT